MNYVNKILAYWSNSRYLRYQITEAPDNWSSRFFVNYVLDFKDKVCDILVYIVIDGYNTKC